MARHCDQQSVETDTKIDRERRSHQRDENAEVDAEKPNVVPSRMKQHHSNFMLAYRVAAPHPTNGRVDRGTPMWSPSVTAVRVAPCPTHGSPPLRVQPAAQVNI